MSVVDTALSVVQDNKSKTQTGDGGWIGALVAGIIVIIVTAIFGYMAWRKGQAMAILLHEKAVKEEQAHQAAIDAVVAVNEEAVDVAMDAAEVAHAEIIRLEAARVVLEEEHAEVIKRIDAITSWSDVDRYLSGSKPSTGPTI